MKPILFILCGYPFSGKSTLCKEIVQYTGKVVHCCIDGFYLAHSEIKDEEERWETVFLHVRELSCTALKEGKHVLYDATNYLKKERTKLRRMAEKFGGNCAVIYLEMPKDVARQRLMENRQTLSRKDVTEEAWEEVTGDFEVPSTDENVIVFRWGTDDMDEWIRENF